MKEKFIIAFSWVWAMILPAAVFCIIAYLFVKGAAALNLSLIFGETDPLDAILLRRQVFDGLFPAILGTFALVLLSVCIAVPAGLAAGIFLAEYSKGIVKKILSLFFDILAGIPSVVVGLFGFSAAVFLHKNYSGQIYPCLLISALSLAFLVLPYIIRTTQVSLENLPLEIRLTGPALGASPLQNLFYVLIPRAFSGILIGIILAIGRCAEDTAVIMLTGVVASAGVPRSLFSPYEALPFYIYYISSQYSSPRELAGGYGAAIILLGICMVLFLFAFAIEKRVSLMRDKG